MRTNRTLRIRAIAGLTLLAAVAGACGGGGGDDTAAKTTGTSGATASAASGSAKSTTTKAGTTGSTGTAAAAKQSLKTTDIKVSFVNTAVHEGTPIAVDIYFGAATTGEKVLTVEPNTQSTEIALKVPDLPSNNNTTTPSAIISIMPKGETSRDNAVMVVDDKFTNGERRMYLIGSKKVSAGQSTWGGTTTPVFISGNKNTLGTPEAGKALVYESSPGLNHLAKNGVVPGVKGTCFKIDNKIVGGGNVGAGYTVDPGTYDLAVFDMNTACATPLGTVNTKVAAGDRLLLVGYGGTEDARKTMVIKL